MSCIVCGKEADKYTTFFSICYLCRVARWTAKDYQIENCIWHHCPGYDLCQIERYPSPPTWNLHLKMVSK